MSENFVFWACLLVIFIGFVVIVGIIWFGFRLSRYRLFSNHEPPFYDQLFHDLFHPKGQYNNDIPKYLYESYTEFLQRRNEFWTSFGQVLIAVLIVIVLSILLMTKSISAEAGLPILSGISGFAIAKGVSSSKGFSLPHNRQG